MKHLSRRHFLRTSGSLIGGAILSACGTGSTTSQPTAAPAADATTAPAAATAIPQAAAESSGPVTLRWWDHYSPLEPLHNEMFAAYSQQHANVTVQHEIYNLPDLGEALQLAFNSNQAPDVHAIASLNVPTARLVTDGWFTPLDDYVDDTFKQRFPAGQLLEGFHTFDGKLYSFPLFGFRSHTTLLWYNKQLMEQAGINPETDLKTWDNFREAARKLTEAGNGQSYGWIQAIQLAERLGTQISELAQTAGAAGAIDWKTGAYSYHSEPFLQAIEFAYSLQKDGYLFPGSNSLDARNARARFAAGAAGMNFDGPWSIGVIQNQYADFLDLVGVTQIPVPDASQASYLHRGPTGGDFWISSQSQNPQVAADILQQFNTDEYYVRLAERMDQPPLNLSVVEKANVHPTYKQALGFFEEIVRLEPSPLVKNAAIAQVQAEMRDIRPNFGEIVQGVFSGDIPDYRSALTEYSEKMTAERDRAIKAVQDTGTQVSLDDWVFANWDASKDYTSDMYS